MNNDFYRVINRETFTRKYCLWTDWIIIFEHLLFTSPSGSYRSFYFFSSQGIETKTCQTDACIRETCHLQTIHIKTSISLINSLNLILRLRHLFKLRYVMAVSGNGESPGWPKGLALSSRAVPEPLVHDSSLHSRSWMRAWRHKLGASYNVVKNHTESSTIEQLA